MDYQYTKLTLMKNPVLYKLGMEDKNFGGPIFWAWIGYAFW